MNRKQIWLAPARLADAVKIAELSRDEIESGLGWSWTVERVARSIKRHNTRVLKAMVNRRFAGFGIMSMTPQKANLNLLAISPEFRRLGIATMLVEALEEEASHFRIADFYVQVRETNTLALRFYEKHGYEMIDRNAQYYQDREAAVILYKYCPSGISRIHRR